ncbi:MAG TPA: LCP family protein [Bacillota bacterium]|nr:LCP family protein [Bacillota bacterium]
MNIADGSRRYKASVIKKRKKILIFALVALSVFVLSVGATVGIYAIGHPESNLFGWFTSKVKQSDEGANLPTLSGGFNLLVVGVDERTDDLGRSDTMIFFSLPADGGNPLMLSIPRDTMIWEKEAQAYDRINNVFPTDGIEATVSTVQNLLGVPIDGYVKINIEGFVELVDILGGVSVMVDEAMDYDDPYQDLYIHLLPGETLMDGQTAMEYVRFRADGAGDIGRIARQQKFIKAAMSQALSVNKITKLPSLIRQGFSMLETNLSLMKLLTLANTVITKGISNFDTATLPGDGLYYGDMALYMLRLDEMYEMLADLLVPTDQEADYLKLLEQNWMSAYMALHDAKLLTAQEIWEETGLSLSEAQYAEWLAYHTWVAPVVVETEDPPIVEPVEPVEPPVEPSTEPPVEPTEGTIPPVIVITP